MSRPTQLKIAFYQELAPSIFLFYISCIKTLFSLNPDGFFFSCEATWLQTTPKFYISMASTTRMD